jgi:hypothetical protein
MTAFYVLLLGVMAMMMSTVLALALANAAQLGDEELDRWVARQKDQ